IGGGDGRRVVDFGVRARAVDAAVALALGRLRGRRAARAAEVGGGANGMLDADEVVRDQPEQVGGAARALDVVVDDDVVLGGDRELAGVGAAAVHDRVAAARTGRVGDGARRGRGRAGAGVA